MGMIIPKQVRNYTIDISENCMLYKLIGTAEYSRYTQCGCLCSSFRMDVEKTVCLYIQLDLHCNLESTYCVVYCTVLCKLVVHVQS